MFSDGVITGGIIQWFKSWCSLRVHDKSRIFICICFSVCRSTCHLLYYTEDTPSSLDHSILCSTTPVSSFLTIAPYYSAPASYYTHYERNRAHTKSAKSRIKPSTTSTNNSWNTTESIRWMSHWGRVKYLLYKV